MNILKKFVVGFVALIVLMAGISCSLADTIVPLADSVFDATKVELSSSGRVKLYCVTYENMATIKVTACWLEKRLEENGNLIALSLLRLRKATTQMDTPHLLIAHLQLEAERTALPQHSMLMVMK